MTTWIAEASVVFVLPSGERRPGRIAIGMPEADGKAFRCAFALDGVHEPRDPPRAIFGDNALQALLLTVRFLGYRLHDVRTRGWRVFDAGDDDAPETDDTSEAWLQAHFGPLLCHPTPRGEDVDDVR